MSAIVVLGSANLDLVVRQPRLPRPGETMFGSDFSTVPGRQGAEPGGRGGAGRRRRRIPRCGRARRVRRRSCGAACATTASTPTASPRSTPRPAPRTSPCSTAARTRSSWSRARTPRSPTLDDASAATHRGRAVPGRPVRAPDRADRRGVRRRARARHPDRADPGARSARRPRAAAARRCADPQRAGGLRAGRASATRRRRRSR